MLAMPAVTHPLGPRYGRAIAAARPQRSGIVTEVVGLSLEVRGLVAAVGDVVRVKAPEGEVLAEVVAVAPRALRCMPLVTPSGLRTGLVVTSTGGPLRVPVGSALLGRVLDGLGRPIDGKGRLGQVQLLPLDSAPPHALERARIDVALSSGVRALDTLATVGRGQRMGLFAGSGVGKSTLLSMIARGTDAEVSVIALIGERGREVREFLEDDLGPDGLARSVVVVATSDEPAMTRLRAAMVATRIAEGFRERGSHAVLMMDSLTRVAMAQREIGLSVGEPPATRGYPPSTFSVLARLLERAGTGPTGSVTGMYTVLVDGDDHNEPIADAARSILDGHVVLTRELAVAGHYPAIDVLASLSRVAGQVTDDQQRRQAQRLRQVLAAHRRARDLLDVGAYAAGSDPLVDAAVAHRAAIDAFLTQRVDDSTSADVAWLALAAVIDQLEGRA